jgi:hypothetical protein
VLKRHLQLIIIIITNIHLISIESKKGVGVKVFNFNESYEAPVNKYNDKRMLVEWGKDNCYPNYLLDLYQYKGGSLHQSIINKKTKLISGNGFEEVLDDKLKSFIKSNRLDSEVKKLTLDYEIYNGFSFEVIWNKEGSEIVKLNHLPFNKLRVGIESDEKDMVNYPHVWFSNNWKEFKKEENTPQAIRLYDPSFNKGKQCVYYSEYSPSVEVYPICNYSSTINWIEMSYEVSVFHLNQLKQGFSPSFILNFATGIPTEEEQDEFFKNFKRNYSGTNNGGKIIITYSEGSEGKPELTPIQLNDSDERFIMLNEQIQSSIAQGHEVPVQLVVLQPGKLGSTEERMDLMIELQEFYVTPRQEVIENVLNEVLLDGDVSTEGVKLKEYKKEEKIIDNE